MNIKRYVVILLLLLGSSICSPILEAETWYVDDISDCSGTGSTESPFCKIEDAVAVAVDGDIIFVEEGTYEYSGYIDTSPIILKSGIVLRGANAESTFVSGNETGSTAGLISGADNSIIENLTFTGSDYSSPLPIICDNASPTIQPGRLGY